MRHPTSPSHSRSSLTWPLLPAPMLNGNALALRPALTFIDRQRYLQFAPSPPARAPAGCRNQWPRLLRADLIEDKQRGCVVGSLCVLAMRSERWTSMRLHAMHDTAAVRADILRMLRSVWPNAVSVGDDDREYDGPGSAGVLAQDIGKSITESLGIPAGYATEHRLVWIDEPRRLHYAGRDYVGRTLWLQHGAMQAWRAMQSAARESGAQLEAVSGFRSIVYQSGILRRKLERGMDIAQVLTINTAPGYSEHHSGRAIDIGTPGCTPAEEEFETTPAFAWLRQHGAQFGFRMSYPRGNPHGVIYEPWHWYWTG